jgi:hypothetical protein
MSEPPPADRDLDRPPGPGDPLAGPLDPVDPRFVGAERIEVPERPRRLVETIGPGASPQDPRVRLLRGVVPALGVVALLAFGAMFFRALAPGPSTVVVGDEGTVRAAVAERPLRVCREPDGAPCAWLTVVDSRLLALSTSGAVPAEHGRQGVGWCPSSGYFGSNATGSRYDAAGNLVVGPSPRGLDRFTVRITDAGEVAVHFGGRTAGRRAGSASESISPDGPDCDSVPYAWDIDLPLD